LAALEQAFREQQQAIQYQLGTEAEISALWQIAVQQNIWAWFQRCQRAAADELQQLQDQCAALSVQLNEAQDNLQQCAARQIEREQHDQERQHLVEEQSIAREQEQLELHRALAVEQALQAELASAHEHIDRVEQEKAELEQVVRRAQEEQRALEVAAQQQSADKAAEAQYQAALDQLLRDNALALDEIRAAHAQESQAQQRRLHDLQLAEEQTQRALNKAGKAQSKAESELERQLAALAQLKEHTQAELKEQREQQRADAQKSTEERVKLLQQVRELSSASAVKDLRIDTLTQQLAQSNRRADTLHAAELKRCETQAAELRTTLAEAQSRVAHLEKQLRDQEREFAIAKMRLQMDYELQKSKGF
jgi:hypothetical protein